MSGDVLRVNGGMPFLITWSGRRARYLEIGGTLYGISGPGSRRQTAPLTSGDLLVRVLNGRKHELDRTTVRVQGVSGAEFIEDVGTPEPPPPPPPEPPPPPPPTEQLDIFLINAATDARVHELLAGETIDLDTLPEINFEAAANADTPGTIASIRVSLDGTVLAVQNAGPYSWFGDNAGDFLPWGTPSAGTHTILAEAYDTDGATGTLLASLSRTFTIVGTGTPPPPPPPPPSGGLPATVTSVMTPTALAFAQDGGGWRLTGRHTFQTNIAQGEMFKPGGAHAFPLFETGEGWRLRQTDPTFNDSSGRGNYKGQWTCYVQDGEFIEFIRNGPESAPFIHQASPVNRLVSRPLLIEPGGLLSDSNTSRRFAWRIDILKQFPGSAAQGYKCAHLMWGHATIGNAGYAEEDMPEHKFGDGLRGNCFHHHEGTVGGQDGLSLNIDTRLWHLWTIKFNAKGFNGSSTGFVEFWVDGQLRMRRTNDMTTGDVYYAMQSETFLDADPIPTPTSTGPQGRNRTRLIQIWEP